MSLNKVTILKIGFNNSYRNWREDTTLLYSKSLKPDLKNKIKSKPGRSQELPLTGKEISKSLFKKYNINTLLVKE